nr:IS110 family transposase [Virgibacillus sp. AGTR]
MNYNQNHKLSQITPETLIVGIDIAKNKHVARAQDDRGFEFGKRLIFDNRVHGFEQLLNWVSRLQKEHRKSELIIGAEPTGHFWLSLAYYLKAKDINFVLVNPMHVKKSKELDDNSPTKNDTKDARVIAQLIKDGRYSVPNLLDGIYAELREGIKLRDQLVKQLIIIEGRIQNHIQRYFPEFNDVFKDWEGKTALFSLRNFPFPSDLRGVTPEEVLDSSGKFKGQTRITKRGRKKLRKALYLAVRPLVASNSTFKTLHRYYTTRSVNPLKKQQSLIAMCGKLLRVLFVIGRKQCEFEGSKLLQGLTQMKELQAV